MTDVGMVQRREDSGFPLKPGQAFRSIGEEVREDCEGHVPAELRVPGPIYLAHAALTDEGGHFVGAEVGAWCQGHGFQGTCEGDYKPGRGLLGEVHAAGEVRLIPEGYLRDGMGALL